MCTSIFSNEISKSDKQILYCCFCEKPVLTDQCGQLSVLYIINTFHDSDSK